MPLDAICLRSVIHEIAQNAVGSRVDKVYQPDRDEIVLALRGMRGAQRLLLSAAPSTPRMHFIDHARENPAAPPMFCMLLRKHLQGAKIASIAQPGLERIAVITFDTIDELGVESQKYLYCELMNKYANIILCDKEHRILDALRRLEGDGTGRRQLMPGLFYRMPPAQEGKMDPLSVTGAGLAAAVAAANSDKGLDKWLLSAFFGLSPLLCREISYRVTGDASRPVNTLTGEEQAALCKVFADFVAFIEGERGQPILLVRKEDESVLDFTFFPITQYEGVAYQQILPSFSALLNAFFEKKGKVERLHRRAQDMLRTVSSARDRLHRKQAVQMQELQQTQEREQWKRMGDLITANLYQIPPDARAVRVIDYYQPECPEVEIALDVRASPQQNAQKYYKRYAKAKTAEAILTDQLKKGAAELEYLESVLEAIDEAENETDLAQLREELRQTGYLSSKQQKGKRPTKPKPVNAKPFHYRTSDGFDIYAGKNNLQNDLLTLKTAYKNDIWFHTQKIHGSHVILSVNGQTPSDLAMTQAACIAAYHSKARASSMVPVDYSEVRNIKKPAGAKPGMVIYHVYKTAYVTPNEAEIEKLRIPS